MRHKEGGELNKPDKGREREGACEKTKKAKNGGAEKKCRKETGKGRRVRGVTNRGQGGGGTGHGKRWQGTRKCASARQGGPAAERGSGKKAKHSNGRWTGAQGRRRPLGKCATRGNREVGEVRREKGKGGAESNVVKWLRELGSR